MKRFFDRPWKKYLNALIHITLVRLLLAGKIMHIHFSEKRHILPYISESETKTKIFTNVNQLEDMFFKPHFQLMYIMSDFLQQNH